jgi:hypothetical protein
MPVSEPPWLDLGRPADAARTAVRPVFVFGLSGACWELIDPLLANGSMPNLRRLIDEGCRADLQSCRAEGDEHFRPQVAWATIATGCEPHRHGITRFFHTADDLSVPALWHVYSSAGLKTGIYGWPLDWPPPRVNGFVVPSHWARDSRTWPPELAAIKALDREHQNNERDEHGGGPPGARLLLGLEAARHGVRLRTLSFLGATAMQALLTRDVEHRALLLRHAKLELSADIFMSLRRRYAPHLSSFHTFLVDLACHRYWRYHQPELFDAVEPSKPERFRSAISDAYRRVDRILGRIMASLPEGTLTAVLSEHGMQAEPQSAEVGPWRYVIRGAAVGRLVGVDDDVVACPVARWVAMRPRASRSLPTDLTAKLRRIVTDTGTSLFQVHEHGPDEVILKLDLSADSLRLAGGDLDTLMLRYESRRIRFGELARRLGRTRSAMHAERGIIVLHGDGLRRGVVLPDAQLVDVAPTLLSLSGLQVPTRMRGTILEAWEHADVSTRTTRT